MTTADHRALIEQARADHQPLVQDGQAFCTSCMVDSPGAQLEADSGPYPCITARLADALAEFQQFHADYAEHTIVSHRVMEGLVDDAERRVAEVEREREGAEAASIATLLDMKDQRDIVVLELAAAERRVAEALEAATAEAALHDLTRQERDAAERRVAELEEQRLAYANQVVIATQALRNEHTTELVKVMQRAEKAEADLQRYADLFDERFARLAAAECRVAEVEGQLAASEQAWTTLLADIEKAAALAADDSATLVRSLAAANERAERLAAYGQHQLYCPAGAPWAFANDTPVSPSGPCSCGLAAALAGREAQP